MVSTSSTLSLTQDIDGWLDSVCGEWAVHGGEGALYRERWAHTMSQKRTWVDMEEDTDTTPRPKRRAIGIATPAQSNTGELSRPIALDQNVPPLRSSRSTAASSRSSSPSKRQRDIENEFSTPAIEIHNKRGARRWKDAHGDSIPLLETLLNTIDKADSLESQNVTVAEAIGTELDEILEEIEYCQDRSVPEESWSDLVVLPALRLARRLSQHTRSVHVVNVKTIDIMPKDLLPLSVRHNAVQTRRVDYTIALEFGGKTATREARQSIRDHTFNQSVAPLLMDRILCSHLEIKTERSVEDGRPQLAIWCAAGFQKMEDLWLQRYSAQLVPPMPPLAPIAMWRWKEDNVRLYLAVMDSANETVHVLEERRYDIDTDPASLLRVINAMSAVMNWGYTHYLPWFKEFIGFIE
ncbi:hypothetical protein LTR70_010429 [Exophiala xenobiotica]|uniref:PD-(D/E)XK nuclease-like domain-containing protein n=1 Tax=Lithohypha guttulata TaxID=1690604 RepID=A0ABR0JUG9_9EURO|nr:hypothetical protein LTR24_010403 [Lithohypha guttulata]KAK5309285.1 hypothetical protein LTR70_010429 [Exophiala xenobiotica]